MKKNIMMGLGAIASIAAPVVGLISCGDKKPVDDNKPVGDKKTVYPKFIVKDGNRDFDVIKNKTIDGEHLNEEVTKRILEKIILQNKDIFKNIFKNWNLAFPQYYPDKGNVPKSKPKFKISAKIIKGFADDNIVIEFKIEDQTIPKVITNGIAKKTIEITFAKSNDKETIADKILSVYPNNIEVEASNKDFDILKSFTTDGKALQNNKEEGFSVLSAIQHLSGVKSKLVKLTNDKKEKNFFAKIKTSDHDVSEATVDQNIKVIKGFADNKITIEIKVVATEIKPKIIDRGTATKTIEITFLGS